MSTNHKMFIFLAEKSVEELEDLRQSEVVRQNGMELFIDMEVERR